MSYPLTFSVPGVRDFAEAVDDERRRQLTAWGDQRHPDGTGPEALEWAERAREMCQQSARDGAVTWAQIFEEEAAEALAEQNPAALRTELIQCATVIAAWIHDLDRRPR
jgi:hypothetical protein